MIEMVDNSILQTVAQCETKALLQYKFGYRTREGKVVANVGKAIHKAHESWFVNWDIDHAIETFGYWYDKWVDQSEIEPNDGSQRENVVEILGEYYKAHPASFFPFEPLVEGIEKVHKVRLMDGVEFFGLIDLPVRQRQGGALYVCDHKNRFGRITGWWSKAFGLDSQFSGYTWVLQQMFDEVVPGIYINAIEVNKLPNDSSTRCRIHKVPYNQCRLQHAGWQLFIVSRGVELLKQWEVEAKGLARQWLLLKKACPSEEMIKFMPQRGVFTGGCKFCEFKKFCRAGRPEMMLSNFVVEHWRPWDSIEGRDS